MSSTIGGEDEHHDLSAKEKDDLEKKLRAEARKLMKQKSKRNRLLKKANEISRTKSKKADHH